MYKSCKGAQRRMIMLKNTGSELFDTAYFVISENAKTASVSEGDMISEANRIVSKNMICGYLGDRSEKTPDPSGWLPRLLWAAVGVLAGGGSVLLAQLVF